MKGAIYYDWATEGILKISLPDGTGSSFIPNDGKQYNVDPIESNSPGVIPVIVKGQDRIAAAGGQMVWR